MESRGGEKSYVGVNIEEANLSINMLNLDAGGSVELSLSEIASDGSIEPQQSEAVLGSLWIDVSIKPFIALIWIGSLTMVLGFIMSVVRRTKEANVE